MADDWSVTTEQMVQITVGMVLQILEVASVTIRLSDIDKFSKDWDVARTFHAGESGEPCMTFTLTEKIHDPEVPTLPE